MKDSKRRKYKLSEFGSNIRFHERMLLIYLIGGIIPFAIAIMYSNQRNSDVMLEQSKKSQKEEISLICSGIRESMSVAEDVASQIYNDPTVREIASKVSKKDYKKAETFNEDCKELSFIDKYTQYYKEEISSVKIYVKNKTISSNKYFSYVGDGIEQLRWYIPTCNRNGKDYWAYYYDYTDTKKVMQLTRLLQDEKGAEIGVLAVQLQTDRTTEKINKRSGNMMLVYKEDDILTTSFQIEDDDEFVFIALDKYKKKKGTKTLSHGIKEYLVSYERVYTDQPDVYYTVVSMLDYQKLLANVYKSSFIGMGIVITGLVLSVGLIILFSIKFGSRIGKLSNQMHLVATGQYDKMEPIEGTDEAAQLYQELEQMVTDIQTLTTRVVDEKVQKEKLHTKQKEVEFKMLASQINPHFLYNTLETIRMKAKINKEPEIEELVKMLAKIMRRNIQVGDQMVTLKSEIELIENYFVIQNYRFGDRIQTEVVVEENVDTEMLVIPLIMQPFVENAFVHGLETKDTDGKLLVHVMQDDKKVIIEIKDNGVGMSYYKLGKIRQYLREGRSSEKAHIGISNVNQRLRLLYGEEYGVTIQSKEEEGTSVIICFPAHTEI